MLISDDFTEITKSGGEPPFASLRSAPYRWKAVLKSLSLGRGAELVEAERGFAEHNATCKRENSGPLSVALAGASSPRGEPHLSLLKSHLLAAPFRLTTFDTFPKGQARLIAFH